MGSHNIKLINEVRSKRGLPPLKPTAAVTSEVVNGFPIPPGYALTKVGGKNGHKGGKHDRADGEDKRKLIPCRMMKSKGTCKFGDKCFYKHDGVAPTTNNGTPTTGAAPTRPNAGARPKVKAKAKPYPKKIAMCVLESGEEVPISEIIGEGEEDYDIEEVEE